MTFIYPYIPYIFLAFGVLVGFKLPDLDLTPVLPLRHRSAWTHGPVLPFVLLYAAPLHIWAWWFIVGTLPGMAIHLLGDLFPKSWQGSALIKFFPLSFSLPPFLSFVWIGAGVWACWEVFWRLV